MKFKQAPSFDAGERGKRKAQIKLNIKRAITILLIKAIVCRGICVAIDLAPID